MAAPLAGSARCPLPSTNTNQRPRAGPTCAFSVRSLRSASSACGEGGQAAARAGWRRTRRAKAAAAAEQCRVRHGGHSGHGGHGGQTLVYLVAAKMSSNFFFSTCREESTGSWVERKAQGESRKRTSTGTEKAAARAAVAAASLPAPPAATAAHLPLGQRPVAFLLVHKDHVFQHSLAHAHQLRHDPAGRTRVREKGGRAGGREGGREGGMSTAASNRRPAAPATTSPASTRQHPPVDVAAAVGQRLLLPGVPIDRLLGRAVWQGGAARRGAAQRWHGRKGGRRLSPSKQLTHKAGKRQAKGPAPTCSTLSSALNCIVLFFCIGAIRLGGKRRHGQREGCSVGGGRGRIMGAPFTLFGGLGAPSRSSPRPRLRELKGPHDHHGLAVGGQEAQLDLRLDLCLARHLRGWLASAGGGSAARRHRPRQPSCALLRNPAHSLPWGRG